MALNAKSFWYDRSIDPAPWGRAAAGKRGRRHPIRNLVSHGLKAFALSHGVVKVRGAWQGNTREGAAWLEVLTKRSPA